MIVRVVIPYYSDHDPEVLVAVEDLCEIRSVYVMTRDIKGRWFAGQVLLDRPPNDLSVTIDRIKKAALLTMGQQTGPKSSAPPSNSPRSGSMKQ